MTGFHVRRALLWTLVGVAFAATVAGELVRREVAPTAPALTGSSIAGCVFAVLGGLILHHRPRHRVGVLYLGTGLLLALFGLTNGSWAAVLPLGAAWFNSWAWAITPLLIITFGVLLLPDGSRPTGRTGRIAWHLSTAALVGAVLVLPYDMSPMPPALAAALPPLGQDVSGLLFGVWAGTAFAAVLGALADVVLRYRRAVELDRQRLRWIAYCAVLAVLLYVAGSGITLVPGITWDHVMAGVVVTPAVGVTIAIVRHRMLDVDRLVARTLSYAVVTVAVVAIYLGAILLASEAVPAAGDTDLVVAVSTLGAAAAFRPIRRRVQTVVDRRFHRSRYDAERLVGTFSARLRDEVDLATVAAELVATSSTSLRPASISLWTGAPPERGNGSGTLGTYNGA